MNLASIIDGHPDDAPALVVASSGDVTTYGALRDQVASARAGLVKVGVGPGDRVVVLAQNEPSFVVGYLAILGVGAVAVPLNPASPAAELEKEIAAVTASVVLTGQGIEVDVAGTRPIAGLIRSKASKAPPVVDRQPTDLAVLIFTAGTGGAPKAAMLTHGNLLANLRQVQEHPGRMVSADEVALGVLPMFHIFGLNVALGLTLFAGASVVLVERFNAAET